MQINDIYLESWLGKLPGFCWRMAAPPRRVAVQSARSAW